MKSGVARRAKRKNPNRSSLFGGGWSSILSRDLSGIFMRHYHPGKRRFRDHRFPGRSHQGPLSMLSLLTSRGNRYGQGHGCGDDCEGQDRAGGLPGINLEGK